jgi:hypothetical protein
MKQMCDESQASNVLKAKILATVQTIYTEYFSNVLHAGGWPSK